MLMSASSFAPDFIHVGMYHRIIIYVQDLSKIGQFTTLRLVY